MARISENDLILPALYLMSMQYDGCITTTELIRQLTNLLKPTGEDAEILAGRNDTKFSQKVRNLRSHNTLEKLGYATYYPPYLPIQRSGRWCITQKGRSFLRKNIGIIKYLLQHPFSYEDTLASFTKVVDKAIKNPERKILFLDENITINEGYKKIKSKQIILERSKKLREIAIAHFMRNGKIVCHLCCFDFEEFYGELGQGYIEIHHIKPIFMFEDEDNQKSIEEALANVIPVCANCHRVIHRNRLSPISIDEMKQKINKKLYFCE